jgi:hypothetical protein
VGEVEREAPKEGCIISIPSKKKREREVAPALLFLALVVDQFIYIQIREILSNLIEELLQLLFSGVLVEGVYGHRFINPA